MRSGAMKKMWLLCGVVAAIWAWTSTRPAMAKQATTAPAEAACGAGGYRVLTARWDAVLGKGWELRQDCTHPEWPARMAAVVGGISTAGGRAGLSSESTKGPAVARPVLVRAGDPVRLWMQDATVRIEMSGIAEEPARLGERTTVRITRQVEDEGLVVERISGIVRGSGDVEMEQ